MSENLTDAQLDNLERLIDRIERANEKPIGIALSAVPHLRELLAYRRAPERQPSNIEDCMINLKGGDYLAIYDGPAHTIGLYGEGERVLVRGDGSLDAKGLVIMSRSAFDEEVNRRYPAAPATPARDDLRADNERLREALQDIADHYTDTGLAAKHMAAIARAALRDAGGTDGAARDAQGGA